MLLFEEGSGFVVTRNVPAQHIDDSIFLREGITLSALMSRWGCGDGYLPRMLTPLEYVRAGRTHTQSRPSESSPDGRDFIYL